MKTNENHIVILGDNNYLEQGNELNVNKEIEYILEIAQLREDLVWAKQQLTLKDIIIKKYVTSRKRSYKH